METKVPFYNVINILVPGLVFVGASAFFFLDEVMDLVARFSALESMGFEVLFTIAALAIAYEVGYIIFRIGAVIIEPLLKKIFEWRAYDKFTAAKKAGAKSLDMLSREYAYARTHITLFVAISIIASTQKHWIIMGFSIGCVMLFTVMARSHIKKIVITVDTYMATNNED